METALDKEIEKETTHRRPLLNVVVFLAGLFLFGAWLGYHAKFYLDERVIASLF